MSDPNPYDVFCSYSWRDRTAVEAVAQALQRRGLKVFLDRWYLIPGHSWPRALEEILASCRAVAVFVGPQGLGDWQQREAYLALERKGTAPVIPVLLPGADPALGFLSLQTWVDLRPGLDDPLSLEILQQAIRGEPPGSDLRDRIRATRGAVCPYRGLRPFREEDAPFFFGRDEFIDRLVEAVSRQTLVALVGASGCGKSSVARAGLIPRLRSQEGSGLVWGTVTLQPGDRPLQALAAVLLPLLEPEMTEVNRLAEVSKLAAYLQTGDLALRDVVARVLAKQPGTDRLLLVADQWEELYTQTRDEDSRRRFLDEILHAAQDSPLSVVLTLRGDFFGRALSYRPLADRLQEAVVTLGPMTRAELAQAIEEPAQKVGLTFEPGLAERLLDDVGQEPGNLPLLEFALTNLWERRQGGQLLHQAYDDMGRVQGALVQKAEDLYHRLSSLEQQAAARVFLELVQTGEAAADTRRRAALTEVGEETRELVKRLADARLVVTGREEATGKETLEVAHEALIQNWTRLQGWLNADREFLLWRQRLRHGLEDWQRTGRDEGALLRGASLAEAERWHTERAAHLTPGEREFIQASLDLRKRERAFREQEQLNRQRQQRRWFLALSAGLLTALVLLALAGWQWRQAEQQRQVALSRQLAAQANLTFSQQDQYLDRSILLAVDSLQRRPTAAGLQALSRGLALLPQRLSHNTIPYSGGIRRTVLSPGGYYLATVDMDWTVRVWEVDRGREIVKLAHKEELVNLCFSTEGRWLAVVLGPDWREGKTLILLEAATGREAVRLTPGEDCTAMAWDQSGERLAMAWYDRQADTTTVRVLDAASHREVAGPLLLKPEKNHLGTHLGSFVKAMAFSPDGAWLATGVYGAVQEWDLASCRELIRIPMKSDQKSPDGKLAFQFPPDTIAFSPDGRFLASSSRSSKAAAIWGAATGRLVARLPHPGGCRSLAFSPDNRRLAIAAGGKWYTPGHGNKPEEKTGQRTVKVWDASTGNEMFHLTHEDAVFEVAFSQDGRWLATWSWDNTVRLWESATGREVARLAESIGVIGTAFRDQGARLVTISRGYQAQVWEPAPPQEVRLKHDGPVAALAFSPDGRWLATGSGDRTARLWATATGRETVRLAHPEAVTDLAFSPDGRLLATGMHGSEEKPTTVSLWEVPSGRETARLPHPRIFTCLVFSPDGERLATGCRDRVIRVWETATGTEMFRLEPPKHEKESFDTVHSLAFSPDGRWLAAGYALDGIIFWDLDTRRQVMEKSSGSCLSLSFSPDGRWLAAGTSYDLTEVLETISGKKIAEFRHDGSAGTLIFHPSKPWLVTGSEDHTAQVWELPGGREITKLEHGGPVTRVAFSPDGCFVASSEACPGPSYEVGMSPCRALVRVWEAASGVEVAQLPHEKGINDVAFSPDGKLIASASQDSTARLWRWQPEDLIRQACSRLTRNLTRAEWRQYLGDEPYRPTCPDLPVPEE